ncbi:MAG TPA: hypothetical protein VHE54_15970 [Puia sp.]|nr:hypothetical protein [Puia sp.]
MSRLTRRQLLFLLVIPIAAVLLRFYRLANESCWLDERYDMVEANPADPLAGANRFAGSKGVSAFSGVLLLAHECAPGGAAGRIPGSLYPGKVGFVFCESPGATLSRCLGSALPAKTSCHC